LTGKSREIVDVMQRRKINVMCIQEVKWTGQSAREISLMLVKIAVHSEVVNVITGYAPQTGCTQEE